MENIFNFLEIGVQILIPIILVIIGISINKKLDTYKNHLEMEKEWRIKWADAFYNLISTYNSVVTNCVMEVFKSKNILQSNDSNKDAELKKCDDTLVFSLFRDLEKKNYEIELYIHFSQKDRNKKISELTSKVFGAFQEYCKHRNFNFDDFKQIQKDLNSEFVKAHNDILHLNEKAALGVTSST